MIEALHIGNFKAFADTQRVPIKPLTLLFGPNSAGKSSVLHALLFAHEANRTGDLGAGKTQLGGDGVDLGGLLQCLYRHSPDLRIELGADFLGVDAYSDGSRGELSGRRIGIRTQTSATAQLMDFDPIELSEILTSEFALETLFRKKHKIEVFSLEIDSRLLLKGSRRESGGMRLDFLDAGHPAVSSVLAAIAESFTTSMATSAEDLRLMVEEVNALVPGLSLELGRFLPYKAVFASRTPGPAGDRILPISRGSRANDLRAAVGVFFPRKLSDILGAVQQQFDEEMDRVNYLGPLRAYPPRHLAFLETRDPNWVAGGGQAWERVKNSEALRKRVNDWLGSDVRLQTPYALEVHPLIDARYLDYAIGETVTDLRHSLFDDLAEKHGLHDFPEDCVPPEPPGQPDEEELNEFARRANQRRGEIPDDSPAGMLKQVLDRWGDDDVVTRLIADGILSQGTDSETPIELVLIDKRTDTPVSHRDVGIGISQVLPVLALAYGSKEQLIAIEQPEIHIHPGLQAELGDVFIESALGDNKNTFLLETHSEHLILRILRRIRETTEGALPEGAVPIRPSDVAVLYAKPTNKGTQLLELRITDEGEFVDKWPDGFFAERARELF